MKNISSQFSGLQKNKLVIIKKELLHQKRVASFFRANEETVYANNFKPLEEMIGVCIAKISEINDISSTLYSDFENAKLVPFVYLTQYARIEKQIRSLLKDVLLIGNKMAQITEERFDQYIPKPYLERRYSNKAITFFLEEHLKKLLGDNIATVPQEIINVWGVNSKYRLHHIEDYPLIENSFWYYEISRLIPLLVHEVGHIVVEKNEQYRQLKKNIEKSVFAYPLDLLKEKTLVDEILSDFFAFEQHGEAYICALFYNTIYENFDLLYYDMLNNATYVPDPNPDIDPISRKSFEIFVRLRCLIEIYEEGIDSNDKDKDLQKHISEIKNFMKYFYFEGQDSTGDEKKPSLRYIYKEYYPALYERYMDVCSDYSTMYKSIANHVMEAMTKTDDQQFNEEKSNYGLVSEGANTDYTFPKEIDIDYEEIFKNIWKDHINDNNWKHPNILRKNILKQFDLFSTSSPLNRGRHFAQVNEKLMPYELTFYKFRSDKKTDYNNAIQGYQDTIFFVDNKDNLKPQITFGIYNAFSIRKKMDTLEYDKIDTFLETKETKGQHFYTHKLPLSFLCEKKSNQGSSNGLGLILQLQLKCEGAQAVKVGFWEIYNKIEQEANYRIFKSLGPNDFVIIFNNLTIEKVYGIKETFVAMRSIIRRTFSIIFIENFDSFKKINIETSYCLRSKMRLTKTFEEMKKILGKHQYKIQEIKKTTGAIDIEIIWKNNIKMGKLVESIKDIYEQNCVSDIQTVFDKNEILGYCS